MLEAIGSGLFIALLGCLAVFALFLLLLAAIFLWPFAVCWYLGHPIIGVFAQIAWLCAIR